MKRNLLCSYDHFQFASLLFLIFFFVCSSNTSYASSMQTQTMQEEEENVISGIVLNEEEEPIIGATVRLVEGENGALTDENGRFIFEAPSLQDTLVVSSIGYTTLKIPLEGRREFRVNMQESASGVDEVVVVGYGTQREESIVGSITSIKPDELTVPSSNLTTALAGRAAGVISYQGNGGEPGEDNAQFFIRGVASFNNQNDPLILIDGVELTANDLARLEPDNIESFSILKDPTTTAVYGARGANGIILVTTKTGEVGLPQVNFRLETSSTEATRTIEMADPIRQMKLHNEANRTRGLTPAYSQEQIRATELGLNRDIFPVTDWQEELFRDRAITTRAFLNVSGGGPRVRYYAAGAFNQDFGLLKTDGRNPFVNGINLRMYKLRSNVNVDLHENTEMIVRLSSTVDDYRGPLSSGSSFFNAAVRTSPTRFPAVFEPHESIDGVPFIVYGNALPPRGTGGASFDNEVPVWLNPYAELQRGYRDNRRTLSLFQLELKQDLSSLIPGWSARILANYNATSSFSNSRSYDPYYYMVDDYNLATGEYNLTRAGVEFGNEALGFSGGNRSVNSVMYMEAATNYERTFNKKHYVSGMNVLIARENLDGNANSVITSLPQRNIGVSGRYTYGYDRRYYAEVNFGYNASERFARDNRFGFFPSFGFSWIPTNESFFPETDFFTRIRLRSSYGIVGNDNIGNSVDDRFFYLSSVNIDDPNRRFTFGQNFDNTINGVSISRYSNPRITWERGEKYNLGIDIDMLDNAIQFRGDVFQEYRSSILQTRADIPSTLGLQSQLQANIGEVKSQGFEFSLDANHDFSNGFFLVGRGSFTYADNEYLTYEEPDYDKTGTPWRSREGNNVSVRYGYIAERLFVDDKEAINSPQQFGTPGVTYGGGDIKYKDLNKDGVINDFDRAPIGKPTRPKISYGFGLTSGYKRFDFNLFMQGLSEVSLFIDPQSTHPFLQSGGIGSLSENGLIEAYANSHWSENNQDVYALWPRLSSEAVENNMKNSTWWLREGSFLRLKQVEVGYDVLKEDQSILGMNALRVYGSGSNLLTFSDFDLWDPELIGNGLGYPIQRVFNLGVNLKF